MESELDAVIGDDETLFAALYPDLRRFAAVVTPVEVDPDDLVQDALERTLQRLPLAAITNPKAYLFRVMVNLASNHRRRLSRARRALTRLSAPEASHPIYPSDISDLLRLPSSKRAILYLRSVEGLSSGEVASLLGMSEAAVAKATKRAQKRLAAVLTEEAL